MVGSERLVSLLFALGLSGLLFLIERGTIATDSFSYPVYWFGLVMFISLGILQLVWNPYTGSKILAYNLLFALSGSLVSIFIVGYDSPLVYLGWLMLIITSAVYLSRFATIIIYAIFVVSSSSWILLNLDRLSIGKTIVVLSSAVLIGLITYYITDIRNLFNRNAKKMDSSIENERLARKRLSSLINSMADGVLAVDENCKIVEYNGALLNILDLNLTLRGQSIDSIGKLIDKNNQPVDIKKFVQSTRTQQVSRDFRIVYHDKTTANLYISAASVHFGFGQNYTKGFVLVMRDITSEKSLEEERDEFISVISHELRTPIAITEGEVSNAAFLSEKNGASKQIIDAIKQAHEQVLFLGSMVNDLATLSRAERGILDLEVVDINLNELLKELEADYLPQAKAKHLTFKTHIDPGLESLSSSQLYLKEILQNFITNAIKYTETGSVTIAVYARKNGVQFEVSDTGIGISKSDQEKVFDKFFRSEDYRTRVSSGTGLGLYVTIKLVRLIHAEIHLKSQLNQGSTFVINVPNIK